MAYWLYSNWPLLLEIIVPFGVLGMLLKLFLSKPKITFVRAYLGGAYEENQSICWYIQLMNLRRDNALRHFVQREAATDCRIKVRFSLPNGELIYNYALWWDDSPVGKSLQPGSLHEFPLAFENNQGEIHLAGTPVATNSRVPPHRIPSPVDIVADVEILSKKKAIAKSKWLIEVKKSRWTPVNVRRLEI